MAGRSKAEYEQELAALDQAHIQNETSRDTFAGLAHTALFAASISFVGDVISLGAASCLWLLILGWTSGVIGLLALTFSFIAASRANERRRAALNEAEAPTVRCSVHLNEIALYSFPVSLICIFLFVTINVLRANDRPTQPSSQSHSLSRYRAPRSNAAITRAGPHSGERRDAGTASAGASAASTSAASEKVTNETTQKEPLHAPR